VGYIIYIHEGGRRRWLGTIKIGIFPVNIN
jgi:hypothetical protein